MVKPKPQPSTESCWVGDFIKDNPDAEIVGRTRYATHVKNGDSVVAYITQMPQYFLNTSQEMQAIDTALLPVNGEYGAPGLPVRLKNNFTVAIDGKSHTQRPRRIGNLVGTTFVEIAEIPDGIVDTDKMKADFGDYQFSSRLLENDGIKDELILYSNPGISVGYFAIETMVISKDFPVGEFGDLIIESLFFPRGVAIDAVGNIEPLYRYAKEPTGVVQLAYAGVSKAFLDAATYPVVIDPDFSGDAGDGVVFGKNPTYATARSTAFTYDTSSVSNRVGQIGNVTGGGNYYVYRLFLKFDTSAIGGGSTVNQVNLSLVAVADNSSADFDVEINKGGWSGSEDPVGAGNMETVFDNILAATKDVTWRNTSGMSLNTQYTSPNMDTSHIEKAGTTYYSLISAEDVANSTPGASTPEHIDIAMQDHGTSGYRPVLTIDYSTSYPQAAAGAFTPIGSLSKDVSKLATGSVTPAGVTSKITSKIFSGSVTPSATLVLLSRIIMTGLIAPIGALVKSTSKTAAGVLAPLGRLFRIARRKTEVEIDTQPTADIIIKEYEQ